MDTSWNDLGKAFWDGGIFGVAKTLMNQRQAQPKTGDLCSKIMDAAHQLEQAVGPRPAPDSTPPPIPPLLDERRPKVFVFGPNCPMQGLGQWTECIRKAKESLSETTDLLELGTYNDFRLNGKRRLWT